MSDNYWNDVNGSNNNSDRKDSGWTNPRLKAWSSKLPPKISEDSLDVEAKPLKNYVKIQVVRY